MVAITTFIVVLKIKMIFNWRNSSMTVSKCSSKYLNLRNLKDFLILLGQNL